MAIASDALDAPRRLARRAFEWALRDIFGRDYFVSYARRDGAPYAARLAKLLGERHSVYLDQLDVPRGAELPPRLRKALCRASVLVLVGSSEAARSVSVGRELTLFLSTGRPVLLVDIDGALETVPWSDPPWDSMFGLHRQPESRRAFDGGEVSPDVLAYLRDSFTYIRQEQRLLRRAVGAIALIVMSAVTVVVAVKLTNDARASAAQAQQQVLEKSRQAEEATTIANVARTQADGALADVAEARKQKDIALADAAQARKDEGVASANAEVQGRIATSRRLAGEASARLGLRPDLGFLLAAHALDAYATDEARRALFDAVALYPGLDAVIRRTHGDEVHHLAVSGDGALIATRDIYGGTVLWDVATRRPIRVKEPYLKGVTDQGALAFDPSSRLLVVSNTNSSETGSVEIWDVQDKWRPRYLHTLPGFGHRFSFVSNSVLAVQSSTRKYFSSDAFVFWDLSDPTTPKEVGRRPPLGELFALEADPARSLLAFRNYAGVMVCDMPCTTAVQLAKDQWGTNALPGIALSRGRRPRLAAMTQDGNVIVWDLERREAVTTFRPELALPPIPETVRGGIAINRDGNRLAIAGNGGLVIVDLVGEPPDKVAPVQRVIAYRPSLEAIAFVASGHVVLAQTDGTVAFLDPTRAVAPSRTYVRPESLQGPFGVNASGDGRRVVIERRGELFLWTPGSDAPPVQLPVPFAGEPTAVAVSDDGQAIAGLGSETPRPSDVAIVVWDGDGHPYLRMSIALDSAGRSIAFTGKGDDTRLAVFLESGAINIYALKTLPDARSMFSTTFDTAVWQHAFDRSGRRLATTHRPGVLPVERIVVVSDLDRHQRYVFKTEGFTLDEFAFSPDGRALVGFRQDPGRGSIVKWDLSRPSVPPVQMALYAESEQNVPFRADRFLGRSGVGVMSPDAAWLVLGGTGGAVVVWDVERRIALGRVRLPPESHTVTFSDDGEQILAFDNRELTIVEVAPKRLAAHACAVATSGLTDEEAKLFQLQRRVPSICEQLPVRATRR